MKARAIGEIQLTWKLAGSVSSMPTMRMVCSSPLVSA
jgi:hypothetical protein